MWLSRLEAMALHSIRHGCTSRAQVGVQFYPHHARDVAGAPRLHRARLRLRQAVSSTPPSAPCCRLRLRLHRWARWHGELGPCRWGPSRTSSWWKRQGIGEGVVGEKCGGGGGKARHTSTQKNYGECFSEAWRAVVESRTKHLPNQPW